MRTDFSMGDSSDNKWRELFLQRLRVCRLVEPGFPVDCSSAIQVEAVIPTEAREFAEFGEA